MTEDNTIIMDGVTFQIEELPTKLQYYVAQIKALKAKEIDISMELDVIRTAKNVYTKELSTQLAALRKEAENKEGT